MKFYVYEWFIKENNNIFYVGKGNKNRYKVKKHNKLFNYILQNNNCESRIFKEFDTEQEAFECEYERINELWSIGQCQANIYRGGLGGVTSWWTQDRKKEYSKNNVMKRNEQRERMSLNNPMKNKEVVEKVRSKLNKKIVIGETVYNSLKEVSILYNVTDTAIQYWLKRGYTNDFKQCYYFGEEPKELVIKKRKTSKKAVIIDNMYFDSVMSASIYLQISQTTLIKYLKENKPYKEHKCEYANQQPSHKKSE